MGYRQEKNEIEAKKAKLVKIVSCVFAGLIVAIIIFSAFVPPREWKYRMKTPKLSKLAEGELRIHFLDVGQGDSTLIELPDGKIMLIDGGNGDREPTLTLLRYLNALGIDTIDYLVATHADEDHCGGLAEVVRQKKILNAYLPPISVEKAGGSYGVFFDELTKKEYPWQYASRTVKLSGEGEYPYTLCFLHPYLRTDEEIQSDEYVVHTNVLSSVIWLDYQGVSALFMGDAPVSVENRLMSEDALQVFKEQGVQLTSTEILKVSHHGSADATSFPFLGYLQVKTSVISCGKGNSYGHPNDEVIQRLQTAGIDTYRTDEDGTVVITLSQSGSYQVD